MFKLDDKTIPYFMLIILVLCVVFFLTSPLAFGYIDQQEMNNIIIGVLTAGGVVFEDAETANSCAASIYFGLSAPAQRWFENYNGADPNYNLTAVPRYVVESVLVAWGDMYSWNPDGLDPFSEFDVFDTTDGTMDAIGLTRDLLVFGIVDTAFNIRDWDSILNQQAVIDDAFPDASLFYPLHIMNYSGVTIDFYYYHNKNSGYAIYGYIDCIGMGYTFNHVYNSHPPLEVYEPFIYHDIGNNIYYFCVPRYYSQLGRVYPINLPFSYDALGVSGISFTNTLYNGSTSMSYPRWFDHGVQVGAEYYLPVVPADENVGIDPMYTQERAWGDQYWENTVPLPSILAEIVAGYSGTGSGEGGGSDIGAVFDDDDDETIFQRIGRFFNTVLAVLQTPTDGERAFWGGLLPGMRSVLENFFGPWQQLFQEMKDNLSSFFDNISIDFEGSLGDLFVAFLGGITRGGDLLSDIKDQGLNWFDDVPFFIENAIKRAMIFLFVPSEGFVEAREAAILSSLEDNINVASFENFMTGFDNVIAGDIDDITIDLPLTGDTYTLVSWSRFDEYKSTFDKWVKGFLFIFLIFYNFNFWYKVIRGGSLSHGGAGNNSHAVRGGAAAT